MDVAISLILVLSIFSLAVVGVVVGLRLANYLARWLDKMLHLD